MKKRILAAIFELLENWFALISIVATVAFIVFVVGALAFDWSWWNVLYALIAGFVGSWLAGGFRANKEMVADEVDRESGE